MRDESGDSGRLSCRLLESFVRVICFPVFVVAFNGVFHIETDVLLDERRSAYVDDLTRHLVSRMVDQRMNSSNDQDKLSTWCGINEKVWVTQKTITRMHASLIHASE